MKLIRGLKMPPSCRTKWVSPAAQAAWEPRVRAAARAYHLLERETVKAGVRTCTTAHLSPNEMGSQMGALAKDGLTFLPRVRVGTYSGFAHSHPPVEDGKPWNWYGPISNSIDGAGEFVAAEERGDHRTIAKLLGYPACCSEFFSTIWMAGYVDPVWQAAENTVAIRTRGDRLIELDNVAMHLTWSGIRYNGLRLAAHLPCSYSCEATKRTVGQWLDLGRSLDIPGLSDLVDLLNMPMEWDALHGIAIVTTPIFQIVTNTVACEQRHVVRKHGDFMPKEAASGLKFPFANTRNAIPA